MYLVGLTGGIGSGKSTVARRLEAHGAYVIDADAVAREVVEPGEPALEDIRARFGDEVVADDGSLDRQALADIVFDDPDARRALDAITHPRIGERITRRAQQLQAGESGEDEPRIVVIDHPLLIETEQAYDFPAVVVVLADAETRVRRLVERGMRPDDARARIAVQATDEQRLAIATHVVRNDGDLTALHAQVDDVWTKLRAAAAEVRG